MGARGALRTPGSVRDIREGSPSLDKPETVTAPDWLSESAQKQFYILVDNLISADVPIKQVDCHAIAMTAHCVSSMAEWQKHGEEATDIKVKIECQKFVARYQKDSQAWLSAICATPVSRARIGLRSVAKEIGPLAKLLKAKAKSQ